jgi:cytochrome P450
MEQLGAAREMIPTAVEELLRFVSPVLWAPRLPAEDIELDGHLLRKGSRLQLGIGAANHDPAEFPNPEQLDLTRPNVNSLALDMDRISAWELRWPGWKHRSRFRAC